MSRLRRPVCGRYGALVVASLCAWEIAALHPGVPAPTVSAVVRRRPLFGVLLLAVLTHHWFIEGDAHG